MTDMSLSRRRGIAGALGSWLRALSRLVTVPAAPANPHILEQDLEIVFLPGSRDVPERLVRTLKARTTKIGSSGVMQADDHLAWLRQDALERAGRYGIKVDGSFYPHGRIDRIIPGEIRIIAEGDPDA